MMKFNRTGKCSPWMKVPVAFVLMINSSLAAPATKNIFEQNCMACHQVENKKQPIVGPSLVEISHFYKKDLAGFVKWCNSPGKSVKTRSRCHQWRMLEMKI